MKKLCILSFLMLFIGISLKSYGQKVPVITKSEVVHEIDGKSFFIHKVEKGHTLYSISKVYEVEIDSIESHNPGCRDGLALGQDLRIPLPVKDTVKQDIDEKKEYTGKFINHYVRPKETLYGISRIYDVSVEDIAGINEGLSEGLKSGQYLKIPVSEITVDEHQPPADVSEKFTKYTVKAGEELFDIARIHNVGVDELNIFNPALRDGLYAGMTLRIPKEVVKQRVEDKPSVIRDTSWVEYKVKKGENLNDIASAFKLDVNTIVEANPGIAQGMGRLKKNTLLRIPVIHETVVEDKAIPGELPEKDTIALGMALCTGDVSNKNEVYKIALMLPLYAKDADTIIVDQYYSTKPAKEFHVFRFIQFYEGFSIALDSLEKQGLKTEVYVYDVGQFPEVTRDIVKNKLPVDLDLIIGPLYSNCFRIVSDFAVLHNINIINPFTNRQEIIINKSNVFKAYPSFRTRLEQLADYCVTKFGDANIIVVNRNVENEESLSDMFRATLNSNLMLDGRADSSYHHLRTGQSPGSTVKTSLIDTAKNIVIALSSDEIFVHNLIRQLNTHAADYDITLFGMPAWRNMRNIENAYLMNLDLHMFSPVFIDYKDTNTMEFVDKFRKIYLTEPDTYAFQGFDIGYYFLSAMMKYGKSYETCIPYFRLKTLQSDYHFVRGGGNGYENIYVNFYHYKDFSLINARRIAADPPDVE